MQHSVAKYEEIPGDYDINKQQFSARFCDGPLIILSFLKKTGAPVLNGASDIPGNRHQDNSSTTIGVETANKNKREQNYYTSFIYPLLFTAMTRLEQTSVQSYIISHGFGSGLLLKGRSL